VRSRALRSLLAFRIAEIDETVVAALADPAWEVRALAAVICVRARLVAATGALIEALEKEPGRLRKDLDDALFALTGVRMYGDVELWKKWYESNRETVERKAKELREQGAYDKPLGSLEGGEAAEEEADDEKRKGATSAFYGIRTQSKRIVFVVDISRSMQDPAGARPGPTTGRKKSAYEAPEGGAKLDIAKWQLHRAVDELPKDAVFDILVYSESYKLWEPEMVDASSRGKKKAHRFIDQLNGNGTTNIADSLDRALELIGVTFGPGADRRDDLAADTIYLLSDGNPNRGRVSDLNALLDEFLERNRLARLVVHTIGIGEAAGSTFLKDLARRTGGRYVGFR
jgi:Mg-chelatase subunit ChlD